MALLSVADARSALKDMIARLDDESTKAFLEKCVEEAAGDVNRIMEIIMPKVSGTKPHMFLANNLL